jgi:hypothetical protein
MRKKFIIFIGISITFSLNGMEEDYSNNPHLLQSKFDSNQFELCPHMKSETIFPDDEMRLLLSLNDDLHSKHLEHIKENKRIHKHLILDLIAAEIDWAIWNSVLSTFYNYCNTIHESLRDEYPIKRKLSRVAASMTYLVAKFHYENNRPEIGHSILCAIVGLKYTPECEDICYDITNLLWSGSYAQQIQGYTIIKNE